MVKSNFLDTKNNHPFQFIYILSILLSALGVLEIGMYLELQYYFKFEPEILRMLTA